MLRGLDNALIFTATKESCLAACLNEVRKNEIKFNLMIREMNWKLLMQKRFVCRSAEYNYITTKCHLSEHDRRSVDDSIELVDAQGVDYFENLCLKGMNYYPLPKKRQTIQNELHFQLLMDAVEFASTQCRPSV